MMTGLRVTPPHCFLPHPASLALTTLPCPTSFVPTMLPFHPHSDCAALPHRACFDLAASPLHSCVDHSWAPSTFAFHSPVAMHPSSYCHSPSLLYLSFELHAEHHHWGPTATEGPYTPTTAIQSTALLPSRPTMPNAWDTASHMPVLPSLG